MCKLDCPLPGRNPSMLVYQLCMLTDVILTSFKNIFHVSDRVQVRVYVIISSSLKPYQNFGPNLSPDCLLMFSVVLPPVVIHEQRDRQFQNRQRVFCQVARVVSVAMMRENIHYIWKIVNSKYITALSLVCKNIIFNKERIIWGKHFASYQDLFSYLYKMYQLFKIGHCLEIRSFALTWRGYPILKVTQVTWLRSRSAEWLSTDWENLNLWLGVTINSRLIL